MAESVLPFRSLKQNNNYNLKDKPPDVNPAINENATTSKRKNISPNKTKKNRRITRSNTQPQRLARNERNLQNFSTSDVLETDNETDCSGVLSEKCETLHTKKL